MAAGSTLSAERYEVAPEQQSSVDLWRIALPEVSLAGAPLSPAERARADRLVVEEKRLQFLRGRTALRAVLADRLRVEPAAIELELGTHGRPELVGRELAFNLSHSEDLALLAVAPAPLPLGVDVERVDASRPLRKIAERFFAAEELETMRALPRERLAEVFYRGWTRKEAYVKALGTGLSFSSRRFVVELGAGSGRLLRRTEREGDDPQAWWFEAVPIDRGYAAALCWRGDERRVRRRSYP